MMSIANAIELTEDEWETTYRPVTNHLSTDSGWAGLLFETYGEEVEYVKQAKEGTVWTWVDGEDGTYVVSGWLLMNRIGYFITEVPFDNNNIYEIAVDKYSQYREGDN